MPFSGRHVETGSLIGSWPILPSVIAGVPVTLPRTIQSKATILGIVREPTGGYDVDGRSFSLNVDGSDYGVAFSYGATLPLSVVVSQINAAVGATVAFNDNGFLKLQSPTEGTGTLAVHTDPASTPTNVFQNLGLFAETVAYGGDLTQTQNPDPDRQVATPRQMTMAEGEGFEARVFNRAVAQLSINNDRNEGQLSKKRLAIQDVVDSVIPYVKPGTVDGIQLADGDLTYVGKETAPSVEHLRKLFTVLDSGGRELVRETLVPYSTGYTYTFSTTTDGTNRQQVDSAAFAAGPGSLETGDYYLVCTGLTGGGAVFEGVPLKIIEVGPGGGSNYAIIENIDPATGQRVYVAQSGVSGTIVYRGVFPVVVDGVYESITQAEAGTPRLENVRVDKRTSIAPTRIELGNRIVCVGQDFLSGVLPQVGDIVTWAGSTINSPFNNNGDYRIDRILDKETIQVVAADWGPAILNPSTAGTFGTITISTDGAFVKNPFLRFSADTDHYGVPVPTTDTVQIARLKGSTFRDATDANPALLQDEVQHTLETDVIEQAIVKMWGPSVKTVDQVLYTDYRVNIESLNSRLNWEHYTYDDSEKSGGSALDTRSWGRHKDIRPDTIDMWYWTPALTDPRITLRGTGTRGHGSDTNVTADPLLRVVNASGTPVFSIYGDGRMDNSPVGFGASVRTWQNFLFGSNQDNSGLGGYNITGERVIWMGTHEWYSATADPNAVSLCGQQLNTNLDLTVDAATKFGWIIGQKIWIWGSAANSHWATTVKFLELAGTLQKSVTDYGDNRDAVDNLYGIHVNYSLSGNFKVTGNHYGIKIENILNAGTDAYGIEIGTVSSRGSACSATGLAVGSASTISGTAKGIDVLFPMNTGSGGSMYGLRIGAGSNSTGAAMYGVHIGSLYTTGTTATGVRINGASGASASNYGVYITGLGAPATGGCAGVYVNSFSATSSGSTNYGFFCGDVTGVATTNHGISIGTVSGGVTNNYGLKIGSVTGTGAYSIYTGAGLVWLGDYLSVTTVTRASNYAITIAPYTSSSGPSTGLRVNAGTPGATSANYAIYISDLSTAAYQHYGIYLSGISGATANDTAFLWCGDITNASGVGSFIYFHGLTATSFAYGIQMGVIASTTANAVSLLLGGASAPTGAHYARGIHLTGLVEGGGAYGIDLGAVTALSEAAYGIRVGTVTGSGSAASFGLFIAAPVNTTSASYTAHLTMPVLGTALMGIYIPNSSTSTTSLFTRGLFIGDLGSSATSSVVWGVQIGAVAGDNKAYALNSGAISAKDEAYGIRLDSVTSTAASSTAGGLYIGRVTGEEFAYGIFVYSVEGGSIDKTGIGIGGVTGSGAANYGIKIGDVQNATVNYAIYTGAGIVRFGGALRMPVISAPSSPQVGDMYVATGGVLMIYTTGSGWVTVGSQ